MYLYSHTNGELVEGVVGGEKSAGMQFRGQNINAGRDWCGERMLLAMSSGWGIRHLVNLRLVFYWFECSLIGIPIFGVKCLHVKD